MFACTNIDRTYDSALSRLYGFFPTGTGWRIPSEVPKDKWEPPFDSKYNYTGIISNDLPFGLDLGYQPVPIYPLDNILDDPCNNSGVVKSKRMQELSKIITTFEAQHSAEIAKLRLVFNLSTLQLSVASMADLYDTIMSDITLGKDLPKDFDAYDMKSLKFISDYYNSILYNGAYGQLLTTLPLHAIKDKMDLAKSHKLGDKKWSMFFGKELNFVPLVNVLNLTSPECLTQQWKNQTVTSLNCMEVPSFSSNLIFELHEDDAFQHSIRVKYNGQYANLCGRKEIECEYREFWGQFNLDLNTYKQNCYGKL